MQLFVLVEVLVLTSEKVIFFEFAILIQIIVIAIMTMLKYYNKI